MKCYLKSHLFLVAIGLALYGCHLGPSYHPPIVEVPEEWKTITAHEDCPVVTSCVSNWWKVFADPQLDVLEEEAIANNPTLYVALERLGEARAIAGVRRADLFPQLNLNPSYTNTGTLFQLYTPPGLAIPGLVNKAVYRAHELEYVLPFDLSYEVDLWGRLKGQYDASLLSADAQQDAFYSVLLTLTTDLASSYFRIRSFDAQIASLQATVNFRRKNYELNQSRLDRGLIGALDVNQALVELANAESTLLDMVRQRGLEENRLAVLLGKPPASFCLSSSPLLESPPVVPGGIPSDVLLRRPDLLQVENEMKSTHAMIGVAYASFFPKISLTGILGYSSPDMKDFLRWDSRLWSMGANISQSIFDAGRNSANLDVAIIRFEESIGSYKQSVLTAFQEVEDALMNIELQTQQAEKLALSTQAAKQSLKLSLSRYNNGLVNYLQVTNSEDLALQAELNSISILGVRYLSTIQLIKALGGGW